LSHFDDLNVLNEASACKAARALFNLLLVHWIFESILLYQAKSNNGLKDDQALSQVPDAAGNNFICAALKLAVTA
jgi:hypothetical protein